MQRQVETLQTNRPSPRPLQDFFLAVAEGLIPGHSILRGLGERDSIQAGAAGEDLWRGNELSATPSAPASHILIPTPDSAGEQMTAISESAQDNPAGTGAGTVRFDYIDPSGDEKVFVLTLNGQTAVDFTPPLVRFVQDMGVASLGSGNVTGVAAGNIRVYKKSAATLVYNMIQAGTNESLVPHKMVPRGKTLYLQNWSGGESSSQKRLRIRLRADCTDDFPPVLQDKVFLFKANMGLNSSALTEPLLVRVPALCTIKVSAWAQAVNGEATVHWWGILVDN